MYYIGGYAKTPMLMSHVDRYLAIRRATGFALVPIEGYLRHFARFATARGWSVRESSPRIWTV
jgi:integrase/recombinase XerD